MLPRIDGGFNVVCNIIPSVGPSIQVRELVASRTHAYEVLVGGHNRGTTTCYFFSWGQVYINIYTFGTWDLVSIKRPGESTLLSVSGLFELVSTTSGSSASSTTCKLFFKTPRLARDHQDKQALSLSIYHQS
jgi:hypothetical protein